MGKKKKRKEFSEEDNVDQIPTKFSYKKNEVLKIKVLSEDLAKQLKLKLRK